MNLKRHLIDYCLLARASEFYRQAGFKQIEVPWLVEPLIDDLTRPVDRRPFNVEILGKNLGASGESGLRETWTVDDAMESDVDYFTITPCFRDDPEDKIHSREFVKLELGRMTFDRDQASRAAIMYFDIAKSFCETIHPKLTFGFEGQGGGQFDLVYQGLELGSYGVRSTPQGAFWVYGTGLALPRFSLITPGGNIRG